LSKTSRYAVLRPVPDGVKVMANPQLDPAASVDGVRGQFVLYEKSAGFVPAMAIDLIVTAVLAVFMRPGFSGALVVPTVWAGNDNFWGVNLITVPAPERETVCGLVAALSVTVTIPDWGPPALGENVVSTVQVWFTPRAVPHVPGLILNGPPALMPARSRAPVPGFEIVNGFGALVVPTTTSRNFRLVGFKVARAAVF
jgi:hypothetical protein